MPNKLDTIASSMQEADDRSLSPNYYLLRYGVKLLLPRLRGPDVLELGSGEGGMTKVLAENFRSVTTVEGSPLLLDRARRYVTAPNVSFQCSRFEEFEPGRSFNSIIMSRILEHIEHPVPLLRSIARWLASDGSMHIIVPNANALNRHIGKAMGMLTKLEELSERDKRVGHFRVYSRRALEADIQAAGLEVVAADGIFLKPLSDAQIQDWDEKLLDAFFEVGRLLPDFCTEIYVECRPARSGAPRS